MWNGGLGGTKVSRWQACGAYGNAYTWRACLVGPVLYFKAPPMQRP